MSAMIPERQDEKQYPAEKGHTSTDAGSAEFADVMRDLQTGEISEAMVHAEGEERTTVFIWLLVLCCSISGLLFGYDTGVISGALVTINSDLGPEQLSNQQKELITSATTLAALLGGLVSLKRFFGPIIKYPLFKVLTLVLGLQVAGIMSDWTGRRLVIGIADLVFVGGAICQAVANDVWTMIGGRFLIGIGVGLAACIAPLYIQELSPTRLRGRMVVLNVVMITLGQVIAYGIGAGFERTPGGWRWMVGLGAAPAVIQFCFLFVLPESPRILILRGNHEQARKVMKGVYAHATPEQLDLKVKALQASVKESVHITQTTTFMQRFTSMITIATNRRALVVGAGMQAFQQLCGFNTLMYYSATLFKSIGFDQPVAVGLIVSGTNCLFTLIALKWIDKIGRRRIMIWSAPGMVFGLVLASIAFYFMTLKTNNDLVDGTDYSTAWSAIVLLSMIIYVASYATGLGNVPWQQGELFGLEVRGIGTSLCTATNWAGNLIIGSTYLSLIEEITAAGAFGFYAGLCFLGCLFVWFCFPETAGLSLEEVRMVFRDGFGIKESKRLRDIKAEMVNREREKREGHAESP